jgi:hypothetical protein
MSPDAPASIRARLLNKARATREEFELTLTRYAAERLLYRLGASTARERCLLKGASLLSVWLRDPYRATRDVDILTTGRSDDASIRAMVEEICAVPCPEDALRFDLSGLTVQEIRPEDEYAGKRVRFRAFLGTARIAVQLDVGIGDAIVVAPEDVEYPTLLEHLPPPRVRAYPREATIAEKFEAMVSLGLRNSRMKDFHDVWALGDACAFDGGSLRRSLAACFERRATPLGAEPPEALTTAFYQMPELEERWQRYLVGGTLLVPPPSQFEVIGGVIIRFLHPLWESIVDGSGFSRSWPPGGPWERRAKKTPPS